MIKWMERIAARSWSEKKNKSKNANMNMNNTGAQIKLQILFFFSSVVHFFFSQFSVSITRHYSFDFISWVSDLFFFSFRVVSATIWWYDISFYVTSLSLMTSESAVGKRGTLADCKVGCEKEINNNVQHHGWMMYARCVRARRPNRSRRWQKKQRQRQRPWNNLHQRMSKCVSCFSVPLSLSCFSFSHTFSNGNAWAKKLHQFEATITAIHIHSQCNSAYV